MQDKATGQEEGRSPKLYYSPGACSLAPHIVARELGIPIDLMPVDLNSKRLASGGDFLAINGKGQVPVLELAGGERLTEGPAIVQYLADQKPNAGLIPRAGTFKRYRLQEWLNFITSELHKGFSPLFRPTTPDQFKRIAKDKLAAQLDWLDGQLLGKDYLLGKQFTVADAYCFAIVSWSKLNSIDLTKWVNLSAYMARVGGRPKVREALHVEGLIE